MPDDTRSPSEIERDIERERSELSHTIDELQERLSLEGVFRAVRDQFNQYGGEVGGAISRQVKENPLALAVAGVGLAWLIFGNERAPRSRIEYRDTHRFSEPRYGDSRGGTSRGATGTRYDDPYGSSTPRMPGTRPDDSYVSDRYARYKGTSAYDNSPDWARPVPAAPGYYTSAEDTDFEDYDTGPSMGERASGATARAGQKAGEARDAAGSRARHAADSARATAGRAAEGTRDRASHARDTARAGWERGRDSMYRGAQQTRDRARNLRYRIAAGTEHLSEDARARVIAARERAIDAQENAARALSRGRDSAADFYEDHPLVAGALALAFGAAIGGSLPRTRTEDEYLGGYRDELIDEAERIFREETEKARKVADAAAEEARNVAEEKRDAADQSAPGGKSAARAAADETKDAASRVGETAKKEADKQNLGKPKT